MPRRIAYNPNMILPPGTQVVTRAAVSAFGGQPRYAEGAVAEIVESPADHDHSYRVRFPDGGEAGLRRTQFAVLKHLQRERIAPAACVLEEFDLMHCVIFRCITGSQAYGLADGDSDVDRRGVYLPPAELHWSLWGVPEQLESPQTEECYWELGKFLTLALKANPNVLECLYTPLVEHAAPLAREMLAMREAFLSKLLYQTYNGYVLSQFKKLQSRLRADRPIKWKHAMHLIRLLLAGVTALREGRVPVDAGEHRERLLAIRRGETPWEEVDRWRLESHRAFDAAFERTKLPDRPDYERVNALLVKAREQSTRLFTERTDRTQSLARRGCVPAFAIIRVGRWPEPHEVTRQAVRLHHCAPGITPVRVVLSAERAESEVRRLNTLNASKGCRYYYEYTRLEPQQE